MKNATHRPLDYASPGLGPDSTLARGAPWRSIGAFICLVAAGWSGRIAIDEYSGARDYIAPTVFWGISLVLSLVAVHSKNRRELLFGWSVLSVALLLCVFMLVDRLGWIYGFVR